MLVQKPTERFVQLYQNLASGGCHQKAFLKEGLQVSLVQITLKVLLESTQLPLMKLFGII